MAIPSKQKSKFELWQDGIDKAANEGKWNAYDCDIQMAVGEFNRHLANTPGYFPLDWILVKTMIWVESGANSKEWKLKPMQIGVKGDPGLNSFLSGEEGGNLILPPSMQGRLNSANATSLPYYNIRAGIGYLLMRMANFGFVNVTDPDAKVHEVTVKSGDSLDKLARRLSTTIDTLRKLNNGILALRPGQILKYQKASVQKIITGWRPITTQSIALRYNGGGDGNYAKKLDYAQAIARTGKAATCAQ